MIKKTSLLIYTTIFSLITIPTLACAVSNTWQPVIAVGLGTATAYDVGQDQDFPIQNPATDEFYNYDGTSTTQTSFLSDVFIGVEKSLSPKWALQLGLDYNQTSPFSAQGTLLQGVDTASADSYTYNYEILTKQLSLEGKLLYTFKTIYHPYALVGLGAAFNRAQNYSTNVSPFLAFTRTYANNTTTSFSPTIGVGFDADVTSTIRAGIGYRFTDLGKVSLGDSTIDGTPASGTLSQSHLYSSEVLAQITWMV